jgi:hypothetical protein
MNKIGRIRAIGLAAKASRPWFGVFEMAQVPEPSVLAVLRELGVALLPFK